MTNGPAKDNLMRDVCRRGLPGHGDGGDDHGLMWVGAGVAAGRIDGDALDLDFSGGGGHFLSSRVAFILTPVQPQDETVPHDTKGNGHIGHRIVVCEL